jgi:hypothetical protein
VTLRQTRISPLEAQMNLWYWLMWMFWVFLAIVVFILPTKRNA